MSSRHIPFAILIFALSFNFLFSCRKSKGTEDVAKDEDTVMTPGRVFHPLLIDSLKIDNFISGHPAFGFHRGEILSFYKNRDNKSAWFNEFGIVEQGGFFMNLLENFDEEGLRDSVIYYGELKPIYQEISEHNFDYSKGESIATQLELFLTAEFFVYAQKVWFGLNEKTTQQLDWYIKRKTVPSVSVLDSILAGGKNAFTSFEPKYPQYKLLKEQLKKYKKLSGEEWDSIYLPADKKSLKLGDSLFVISELKRRLYLLGDLAENDSDNIFNADLLGAIKRFQSRHGLTSDGEAGEKFFREINCTPANRAKQIEINMERCRWIPDNPKGNFIIVNIPEYIMHIYEDDTIAWDQKVVVGKTSTSTVIFNDELEYIVFSPYWVPPPSILNNEILPSLKKNPGYLQKENMEAYNPSTGQAIDVSGVDWSKYSTMPYRVRQRPGGSNSLGWAKFIFPNEHNIYFHDTPSRDLFNRESRGFSHGCIRIEQPMRFAEYLLRNDTTYTKEKIDSLYYLGRETYVKLQEKIPVFIVYFTSWVDTDGNINFRRDIYGHDAKLEKTLFE